MNQLKSLFLLDPDVVFLNHGSFGATPRPVLDAYQQWQRHIEAQPVRFFMEEFPASMAHAREKLGAYVHAGADDIVYVPNATTALNIVASSLRLGEGDELLTTNHEYGACHHVWQYQSQKQGFAYRRQPIPLPVAANEAIVETFWQGVTPATKVIFLSHITSSTALILPVQEICRRAREHGILTIVDGAHAPGQLPLDMAQIGADFYFGNAHKWLCSPKGAAFLFARRDVQPLIEPFIVGWGWGDEKTLSYGSNFLDYLQWAGTDDVSAYLSVPAAIEFQAQHHWPEVRRQCHLLLQRALDGISQLTGQRSPYPDDSFYRQMAVAPLPAIDDLAAFKSQLYDSYRIEIPAIQWHDRQFIRLSVQGYNTQADVDALLAALAALLAA